MSNDFIPFAVGGSANVITQSAYAALTSITQNGFQSGIAQSNQLNKVWRQSSIMAAVLAQFIVDQSGQNAVDDGTTATLEANLLAAIKNATKQTVILTDTGVANAYTAANTPALSALPSTGYVQRLNIAHANTGASTYAPDGLAAKPIYGLGLQPLQGGELPVGVVVLMYLVQAGVNSGNGAWIIIESLGGAQQIPAATQSQHAVQMGQQGIGQCRLSVVSTTQIKLSPYNGNNVIVNGVPLQIPPAGITASNSGLSATTVYYVYLGGTTASPTLSLSTTGHSTASNGIETKTGDTTQTLVGMIRTGGSSQFLDTAAARFCLNWFNKRKIVGVVAATPGYTFTNTTLAEINAALRVEFICWADDTPIITGSGAVTQSNTASITSSIAVDTVGGSYTPGGQVTLQASFTGPFSVTGGVGGLSEGYHFTLFCANVNSGTGTLNGIQTVVNLLG
jgi:hypothetical protein